MSLARRLRLVLVVALVGAAAVGCGDAGGLRGAGPTATANSPERLWPQIKPASSPAWDLDEAETHVVQGVTVPGDDIRRVNPVAVVRAEIASDPSDYAGAQAPYRDTNRLMKACGTAGKGKCPVLQPYYRDLTGDGKPDLTLGFRLSPGDLTAVRVYTVESHRLVQVMAWEDAVSAVELAGRSVIIRSPSDLADYEYRLQWTWDAEQKAMLLTHDEMLRTDGRRQPSGKRHGMPAATPQPLPSATATGTGSGSGSGAAYVVPGTYGEDEYGAPLPTLSPVPYPPYPSSPTSPA
ncbi:hypothetical protein [Streptomyces niveiscabiei]|uniref:hypothetical protein n=1 Tax=Streptomyces niveiscabiei TaxID=164115 RepID=UPI0029CA1AC6|nr:hypothetical protein [Streptomyces niveiscabiei]